METRKQKAWIEDWFFLGGRLVGNIRQHPRQKEFRADLQQTSKVLRIDINRRLCETENTIYHLGKPNAVIGVENEYLVHYLKTSSIQTDPIEA